MDEYLERHRAAYQARQQKTPEQAKADKILTPPTSVCTVPSCSNSSVSSSQKSSVCTVPSFSNSSSVSSSQKSSVFTVPSFSNNSVSSSQKSSVRTVPSFSNYYSVSSSQKSSVRTVPSFSNSTSSHSSSVCTAAPVTAKQPISFSSSSPPSSPFPNSNNTQITSSSLFFDEKQDPQLLMQFLEEEQKIKERERQLKLDEQAARQLLKELNETDNDIRDPDVSYNEQLIGGHRFESYSNSNFDWSVVRSDLINPKTTSRSNRRNQSLKTENQNNTISIDDENDEFIEISSNSTESCVYTPQNDVHTLTETPPTTQINFDNNETEIPDDPDSAMLQAAIAQSYREL